MSNQLASVAVVILTHNHERFISRCIRSALSQKTRFFIEVLVFDDFSEDRTRDILKEFAEHDERVSLFLSEKHLGAAQNGSRVADEVQSTYIAFLDGDDFWTYDRKIDEQVQFLEENPAYAGSFHDASLSDITNSNNNHLYKSFKRYSQMYKYNQNYFPWDALARVIIPHSSLVFRTCLLNNLKTNSITKHKFSGGWMLTVLLLKHNKFKFFNKEWSTYVNHDAGVTKLIDPSQFNAANVAFLKTLLSDDYYKNIKKDVFKSIVLELGNWLHSPSLINESRLHRITLLASYAYHFFIWGVYEFAERYRKQF